jgi:hypothetical protein
MSNDIEAERKMFEDFIGPQTVTGLYRRTEGNHIGDYCLSLVQSAWEAWQARAALAAPQQEPAANTDVELARQWREYFGHITPEEACRAINELQSQVNALSALPPPAVPVLSDANSAFREYAAGESWQLSEQIAQHEESGFFAGWDAHASTYSSNSAPSDDEIIDLARGFYEVTEMADCLPFDETGFARALLAKVQP